MVNHLAFDDIRFAGENFFGEITQDTRNRFGPGQIRNEDIPFGSGQGLELFTRAYELVLL